MGDSGSFYAFQLRTSVCFRKDEKPAMLNDKQTWREECGINTFIRELRAARRISQEELASAAGTTRQTQPANRGEGSARFAIVKKKGCKARLRGKNDRQSSWRIWYKRVTWMAIIFFV